VTDSPELPLPESEQASGPTPVMEALLVGTLLAAGLSLFFFAWLSSEMVEGEVGKFDAVVRDFVHTLASPARTQLMLFISRLGYDLLIWELVIALAVFWWLRWRRGAVWLAVTMIGAVGLDIVLKQAFHRIRPDAFFTAQPSSFSFPSGHALSSFCFYAVLAGLIAYRVKSMALKIGVGVAAAVLIGAVGFSRIYLGVHYPSDVLAGYLAAAMWVSTMLAVDRFRKKAVVNFKNKRARS
jgi:membrane-associated phospholipid phosphatase